MNADPEMLELFRAEMDAHLPVLSRGLLALEKGPVSTQEMEAMMRAAHSIKGAARIVGIEHAGRVSHIMEDCFTAAKECRITLTSGAVDVLLEGLDALHRICSPREGQPHTEESLQAILKKIAAVRDGEPVAVAAASAVAIMPPAAAARATGPAASLSGKLVAATVAGDEPGITLPVVWDDRSIAMLRREMLDTLALSPARVRLDCSHSPALSARALALLVSFARQARQCAPPPVIQASGAADGVRTVLRIAGVDRDLQLESTV